MPAQSLETAARAIFHASWQATILAIVVLFICRVVPRLPASARSWLWLIVLLRLVVPWTPQSSWSLFNLANVSRTTVNGISLAGDVAGNRSAATSAQMVHGADDRAVATPTSAMVTSSPGTLALESATDQSSADVPSIVPTLTRGAAFIWALGLVALLARGLRSWISLRRLLRASRVVEEEWPLAVLEECRLEAGIRRFVELVVTEANVSPALTGAVFPRVVLSQDTLMGLGPAELAWLFRHELGHLRRWDLVVHRLWHLACALHWFNPVVWWAASRARIEAELACDESVVIRATVRERVAYGQTLLKVAELLSGAAPLSAGVGLWLREPALSRRVRALAGFRQQSRAATVALLGLSICLAASGLTDAIDQPGAGPDSPDKGPTAPASEQRLDAAHAGKPDKPVIGVPVGHDGRPQLSAVLDAWERGRAQLKSYDVYLKFDFENYGNMGKEGWPRSPKPSFARNFSHDVRAGAKLRVEQGVEKPGQKATGDVSVWDGALAKYSIAGGKEFGVEDGKSHFPAGGAGYEYCGTSCANGSDMIAVLRNRKGTIVEQADDSRLVLFTPASMPFGYRIWLDPKKNFLPTRIDRLLGVDGSVIVDLEQDNTLEEVSHGVWAPVKFVVSFHPQTKESATKAPRLVARQVITVNRQYSRFNVPIADSDFRLEPPATSDTKAPRAAPVIPAPARRLDPNAPNVANLATTDGEILVHVLGPDGKPLAGASIFANVVHPRDGKWAITNRSYASDADGEALVKLSDMVGVTKIWVRKQGYPGLFACWFPEYQPDAKQIPSEITFKFPEGTTVGGIVKDESGKPIAGVKIEAQRAVDLEIDGLRVDGRPVKRPVLALGLTEGVNTVATTDSRGRWKLTGIPAKVEILLKVSHPDYVSDSEYGGLQNEQSVTTQSLREQTAQIVMRHKK